MLHKLQDKGYQIKPFRRISFFRHLPPTAVPVEGQDLWRGFKALFHGQKSLEAFQQAIRQTTNASSCFLVSSGRAALTIICNALKRLSNRTHVIVPAYTCPTVAQSIITAGLVPIFCDVSPETLGFDLEMLEQLINEDVLAILPTHLYGYAQDITDIQNIARPLNIFIIEDAAQAYGATFENAFVGTLGDVGFYSMGRGKCIPSGHGGIIVAKEPLLPAIEQTIKCFNPSTPRFDVSSLLMFIAYGIGTHPIGWWFISRSPLNPAHEGMKVNSLPTIRINGLSTIQSALGLSLLERLTKIQEIWQSNAQKMIRIMHNFEFLTIPKIHPKAKPVFLRLPIILNDETQANELYSILWREGIGVSKSYYRTLPDLFPAYTGQWKNKYPGADHLAKCLLTLPTNSYLTETDLHTLHVKLKRFSEIL